MNNLPWVDPRLPLIRVVGIRSYLLRRGWQLQPYPGPELLVFGGRNDDDDGEPILQVVPSSERMRDFPMRVEELIAALSVLEDRPAGDILTDILQEPTPDSSLPTPEPHGASAVTAPRVG